MVTAIVRYRITLEFARSKDLPCFARTASSRPMETSLVMQGRVRPARTVLCASFGYTTARCREREVNAALKGVPAGPVASHRMTLFQDGESAGT